MNILLTGANGFVGRYLLAALRAAGHRVVPAVRRPAEMDRALGETRSIAVDFNTDTTPEIWLPRLAGIDAVVNCAGVLQGGGGQSVAAIHADAPKALFKACEIAGVRRVVQISAISAGADTEYARTKRAADEALAASTLDWTILRPSLIYAPGAYGGTALFRGLAALPFAVPVIGDGGQMFQPIHVDDLGKVLLAVLASDSACRLTIDPVGPDQVTMKTILLDVRRWLGFGDARVVSIPMPLVRLAAKLGDVIGGTINTTALRQLEFGNTGSFEAVLRATGVRPRGWRDGLLSHPAQTQDRWHARLYFLRPALRWSLGVVWILSGLIGLIDRAALVGSFSALGITLTPVAIWLTCLLDAAIGLAVIARWRPKLTTIAQLAIVAGYTAALTLAQPQLWLDPLGPLLKNLPFVLAVLALAAIENDR